LGLSGVDKMLVDTADKMTIGHDPSDPFLILGVRRHFGRKPRRLQWPFAQQPGSTHCTGRIFGDDLIDKRTGDRQ
jgi:hypothetical protein